MKPTFSDPSPGTKSNKNNYNHNYSFVTIIGLIPRQLVIVQLLGEKRMIGAFHFGLYTNPS